MRSRPCCNCAPTSNTTARSNPISSWRKRMPTAPIRPWVPPSSLWTARRRWHLREPMSGLSATDRSSLAGQVQSLQQQMVALSNTGVQGRFIFSGDQDQTAAYQIIPITNPPTGDPLGNGVTQISMSAATRQVEDPAGGSFSASRTAQEIFDTRNDDGTCAADNVFASLNALRLALENSPDGDSSGIQSAIGNLKQASVHLNAEEAFYGNVQTRM